MAAIFTLDARALKPIIQTYVEAGKESRKVVMRAINWTGDRAETQVKRTLAKQVGLPYGTITSAVKEQRATPQLLEFSLTASGKKIPLKEFSARQTKAGVTAKPWGQRRVFPHTFIVATLGGHVFVRETFGSGRVPRFPIRKLYGPSVPSEMVSDVVVETFQKTVEEHLSDRLEHEMKRNFAKVAAEAAGKGNT